MSYASHSAPMLPSLVAVDDIGRQVGTAVVQALQSFVVAAVLWGVLAAPGFLGDQTSLHAPQQQTVRAAATRAAAR